MPVQKAIVGTAAKTASKTDPTILIIGAVVGLYLLRKGVSFGVDKVKDAAKAGREYGGDFATSFFGTDRYKYAEDQTGSPNPPLKTWWEAPMDEGPVVVYDGTAVPTPPIMDARIDPTDPGARHGEAAKNWFDNPYYYFWFWAARKTLEEGSNKTNSDIFQ
jgi:hypothetical protein